MHTNPSPTTSNSSPTKPSKLSGVGAYLGHSQSLRMGCPNCDTRRTGPCNHHKNSTKITAS